MQPGSTGLSNPALFEQVWLMDLSGVGQPRRCLFRGNRRNCWKRSDATTAFSSRSGSSTSTADTPDQINRLRDLGFVGLKPYKQLQPYNHEKYYPLYERAQELGMPVLFHTGLIAKGSPYDPAHPHAFGPGKHAPDPSCRNCGSVSGYCRSSAGTRAIPSWKKCRHNLYYYKNIRGDVSGYLRSVDTLRELLDRRAHDGTERFFNDKIHFATDEFYGIEASNERALRLAEFWKLLLRVRRRVVLPLGAAGGAGKVFPGKRHHAPHSIYAKTRKQGMKKTGIGLIGADFSLRAALIEYNYPREKSGNGGGLRPQSRHAGTLPQGTSGYESASLCDISGADCRSGRRCTVCVMVRDQYHEEIAVAALEAGKAVYLEKPMALSIEGCDRILETACRTGSKLFVGHNMRYVPSILKMKEVIDSGVIGEIQCVWVRHFINYGSCYFRHWCARKETCNGLLLQKGAHDIDVIHWLAGGYTTRVTGMGKLSVYNRTTGRLKEGEAPDRKASWKPDCWPPLELKGLDGQTGCRRSQHGDDAVGQRSPGIL